MEVMVMIEVPRYSPHKLAKLFPDDQTGEWVWAEDHDKVVAKLKAQLETKNEGIRNQQAKIEELRAQVEELRKEHDAIATYLEYPQEWDTMAYPTLESAIAESLGV
jgi:hypothetical protein